jgi:two-component system C4-dicarboxylate transport response regulator DctD
MFGIETLLATGESNIRHGHFERANGGTILLDEVESMPPDMQAKLLRVLQERTLERISGVLPVPLDIRVIATTKVALHNLVTDGRFRQDLYYRLSGVELQLPPLRERGTDVVMLFMHFLAQNGGATEIPPALISDLLSHDWPGNVRELRNAAGRYAAGLSVFAEDDKQRKNSLAARVADFEKGLIEAALAQNNGSLKRTMLDLDVPRKTLYDKMNKHEIQKEKFHNDD